MKTKVAYLAACAALLALLLGRVEVTSAVTCNPLQLSPCASAIASSATPSRLCCAKIKEQRPCLCQYMKNPNLQKFIKSPGAKKVSKICRTPFPRC
ncbi:Non-specific lipid-transfer protein [Dorcoceras hygrometricum]|uniref:Non-specific lipid-transfer protein n=1 Tax=Dorcoceras hygrometricum TaxID=472368 RepID=A0A2Z7ACY0_9LAMI|nr:Non-specific lipid-transfer protein [Dorcoceras hygrometricum]